MSLGPLLAADLLFFTDLHLILVGLGKRNDLLHIHQPFLAIEIGTKPDAADVDLPFSQPQDRCRQFFSKVLRNQNDPDILSESFLIRFIPSQELQDPSPGLVRGPVDPSEELGMNLLGPLKSHGRHHGRITNGLQLHVATIGRPLELDDHEVRVTVECQQINSPSAVLPFPELLGQHEQVVAQNFYLRLQQALQIGPLTNPQLLQSRFFERTK